MTHFEKQTSDRASFPNSSSSTTKCSNQPFE
jgi:hypothetical protein